VDIEMEKQNVYKRYSVVPESNTEKDTTAMQRIQKQRSNNIEEAR
jgi:hypothetical protein